MKLTFTMNSYYTQYYLRQGGSGLADIGPIYKLPSFPQRGRGSIGNFFAGLFRHLSPLASSGLSAIKDQALKSGSAVLAEFGKKPLANILKEQGKIALSDLTQRGVNKLKKMQKGSGRVKHVKRSRGRGRKTNQFGDGRKRKRKTRNRKSSKRTRFVDILDN